MILYFYKSNDQYSLQTIQNKQVQYKHLSQSILKIGYSGLIICRFFYKRLYQGHKNHKKPLMSADNPQISMFLIDSESHSVSQKSKTKKIAKKNSNKHKENMKEIKRLRQRNRRANHKQYVLELQTKLEETVQQVGVLEARVQELQNQLQTHYQRKNSDQQVCPNCQNSLVPHEIQNNHQIQEDDPLYFFRDSDENYGHRLGARSQCLLLMTLFCLMASVIAHDHQTSPFSSAYQLIDNICRFSFVDYLDMTNSKIIQQFQEHTFLYMNSHSCPPIRLFEGIGLTIDSHGYTYLFPDKILANIQSKVSQLWPMLNMEMIYQLVYQFFQTPSYISVIFGNMIRLHNY